jgi:hypothetical protein
VSALVAQIRIGFEFSLIAFPKKRNPTITGKPAILHFQEFDNLSDSPQEG